MLCKRCVLLFATAIFFLAIIHYINLSVSVYSDFALLISQHQGEGVAAIGKAIGGLWKALIPSDKEPYKNQAAKEKMQYSRNK